MTKEQGSGFFCFGELSVIGSSLWLDDVGRVLSRWVWMLLRLLVAAETGAHRREDLFSEGVFPARPEAREQSRGQHLGGHRLVDGGIDGPAAFAGIFDKAGIGIERVIFRKR